MRFSTFFLTEHVTITNGTINVLTGGGRRFTRPVFPAALDMFLVAIAELPDDYVDGQPIKIAFSVTSPDDSEVFGRSEGHFQVQTLADADRRALNSPLIVDLRGVPLPKPGLYKLTATLEDVETEPLYFQVVGLDSAAQVPFPPTTATRSTA
jgi:hypothetical protein